VRTALAVELEAAGWTVVEAATGEAALAIGRKQHCDMLISDIHLGGYLSGWEVAEGLRASNRAYPLSICRANPLRNRAWFHVAFF
jgi:CheY-like chemotaxis protein